MKKLLYAFGFFFFLVSYQASAQCAKELGRLPKLTFANLTLSSLTKKMRDSLSVVAAKLRNNPNCRIAIVTYEPPSSFQQIKGAVNISFTRAENVRRYFVEREGISNDRISVLSEQPGGSEKLVSLLAE